MERKLSEINYDRRPSIEVQGSLLVIRAQGFKEDFVGFALLRSTKN